MINILRGVSSINAYVSLPKLISLSTCAAKSLYRLSFEIIAGSATITKLRSAGCNLTFAARSHIYHAQCRIRVTVRVLYGSVGHCALDRNSCGTQRWTVVAVSYMIINNPRASVLSGGVFDIVQIRDGALSVTTEELRWNDGERRVVARRADATAHARLY